MEEPVVLQSIVENAEMSEIAIDTKVEEGELSSAEHPQHIQAPSIVDLRLDFSVSPKIVNYADEFQELSKEKFNFLKGIEWSPDGTCLLSCSEDNTLRLFEVPTVDSSVDPQCIRSVLKVQEGETVYDYAWYPHMNSADPSSCVFVSTSRDHPIHLWDAFTGQVRGSYRTYSHTDEITAALSVSFNLTGDKLYCGYKNYLRIFDIATPGRESTQVVLWKKKEEGQRGLISCIAFCPDYSGMFACGSYTNTVGIYDENTNAPICLFENRQDGAGITQVQFSPDGNYIFCGARKSAFISCWDIRKTGAMVHSFPRMAPTNQRITFDIDPAGKYLLTGSQDNKIIVYNLQQPKPDVPVTTLEGHKDAVNGVSIHPNKPLLASCSGQRHFVLQGEYADDDAMATDTFDASILVWKINQLEPEATTV